MISLALSVWRRIAIEEMKLVRFPGFDSCTPVHFDLSVCPSMSLASPRLHSRAEDSTFNFPFGSTQKPHRRSGHRLSPAAAIAFAASALIGSAHGRRSNTDGQTLSRRVTRRFLFRCEKSELICLAA